MRTEAEIFTGSNKFQKCVYRKMADYLAARGITEFGKTSAGNRYRHLLPADSMSENFLFDDSIYNAAKARFDSHKGGSWKRLLTNTTASQPCCFNLFVPLQQDLNLASQLFSELLGNTVDVCHIEIEYTPNVEHLKTMKGFEWSRNESIGDQGGKRRNIGTDADLAVFYELEDKRGVLLIEFKYIEGDFNPCASYKEKLDKEKYKGVMGYCSTSSFFAKLIDPPYKIQGRFACGYLKYDNWDLTRISRHIDIEKVKSSHRCPFRFSLNQLWRNILLAERVKYARALDECRFWVLSPSQNGYLWGEHKKSKKEKVEKELRSILTDTGNEAFKRFTIEEVVGVLENIALNDYQKKWLAAFREKYLFECQALTS